MKTTDLSGRSTFDLRVRARLLHKIIEEAKAGGDDRWEGLASQLEMLQKEICSRQSPIVVKMKTARTVSKAVATGGQHARG